MWAGRSNSSLIDCISIRSSSRFSVLLRFHDSEFVKRAERVVVSCNSMSTEVSISLNVSFDAMVLMEIVVAVALFFLA